ncbi:hypothetical protein B0H14DRAFT_2406887 [Mycena olivaceomarginata]|nr:hypothetical protein B0H14DRAFT_2406887 [Mycena olivaceomarginata]
MPAFTTITAASAPRIHLNTAPRKPQAARSAQKLKSEREAHEERQRRIDKHSEEWWDYTRKKAQTMATEFDMKERYFLDLFLQGGAHMVHHQKNANSFNAFKNAKAEENREAGIKEDAIALQANHIDEYLALSTEEKKALVADFEEVKAQNFHLHRDTPRARIQDVSNVVRNIKILLSALSKRVGIEALFCVFRNNAEFFMEPEWFFTRPELENYMEFAAAKRWDTGQVGAKLEAFAIAGCDAASASSCDHTFFYTDTKL